MFLHPLIQPCYIEGLVLLGIICLIAIGVAVEVSVVAVRVSVIVVVSAIVVVSMIVVAVLFLLTFIFFMTIDTTEPAVTIESIRESTLTLCSASCSSLTSATLIHIECIFVCILVTAVPFVLTCFFIDETCDNMLVVSELIHLLNSYDIHTVLFGNSTG